MPLTIKMVFFWTFFLIMKILGGFFLMLIKIFLILLYKPLSMITMAAI